MLHEVGQLLMEGAEGRDGSEPHKRLLTIAAANRQVPPLAPTGITIITITRPALLSPPTYVQSRECVPSSRFCFSLQLHAREI